MADRPLRSLSQQQLAALISADDERRAKVMAAMSTDDLVAYADSARNTHARHNGHEREPGEDDAFSARALPQYGHDIASFLGEEDDTDDDSQDWVVRGIVLRAAPNVIAGTPKSKKTMLALHLIISVAAGMSQWLGKFAIRSGKVLVLAHEDSKRETRRRLWRLARGMGIDPRSLAENLRIADRTQPFHFDREAEMAAMVATLESWRPSIVLMDSLSRMHLADENSKRDMNVVTDAWLTLAAQYDLAILSIHHLVKMAETKDLILQLRGSGDIGAAIRHAVGVASVADNPERSRVWTAGNEPYQPDPFEIYVEDGVDANGKPTIVLSAQDKTEAGVEMHRKVLDALASGPKTARELRKACGGKACRVDEAARELERAGRLVQQTFSNGATGPWKLV